MSDKKDKIPCPRCGKCDLQLPSFSWSCPKCGWSHENQTPCPVCGKYTFDEYDDYNECPICGWGNEGWQYEHPEHKNNYNRMSLNEAKEAYKRGEKVE